MHGVRRVTASASASVSDMAQRDQFAQWERIKRIKKPIVAAVWEVSTFCPSPVRSRAIRARAIA